MAHTLQEITLSGTIKFDGNAPESPLPNPSVLTVKLEDCQLADAPSRLLGEAVIEAHETYVKDQPLKYSMQVKDIEICPDYSMSAVLNVGWRPHGDEWVRRGDYLSDTHHNLEVMDPDKLTYSKDVSVIHYR